MVKKRKYKIKRSTQGPELIGDNIYQLLQGMGWTPEKGRLAALWKMWPEVLGEEFAIASPLGHKGDLLIIGAGDSMEMQELSMQTDEILEKVNNFLQKKYFNKVRVKLDIPKN